MKTFLKVNDLWNTMENDFNSEEINEDSIVRQLKTFKENEIANSKAVSFIYQSMSAAIFPKLPGIEIAKDFLKNMKLTIMITLSTLFLYSTLFLSNIFSLQQSITSYLIKHSFILLTSSNISEFSGLIISFEKDFTILSGKEWIFILINLIVSSQLSLLAICGASATFYRDQNLTINDLLSSTARSWKRAFVTLFHLNIFCLGFIYIVLETLLASIDKSSLLSSALSLIILTAITVLYAYLSAVWASALVVSVMEEKSGVEAQWRAAEIMKEVKLHVFILNLGFMIVFCILSQFLQLISSEQPAVMRLFLGLLVLNSVCLIRMFMLMAYTVLYCQCKQSHGEDIESKESIANTMTQGASLQ